MSPTIIPIGADELRLARAVVLAVDPDENDPTHGVTLTAVDGHRCWTAWSADAIASTQPTSHSAGLLPHSLLVPRRLVEFAAKLAGGDDEILLGTGPDGLFVSIEGFTVEFDHPPAHPQHPAVAPWCSEGARAELAASSLFRLFAMGRVLPAGVDLTTVAAPMFRVDLADGAITGAVDWSAAGVAATTITADALCEGAGAAFVSPTLAERVVGATDVDDVVTLTIPDGASWIEIGAPGWTARLRATVIESPSTSVEHPEQLELPFVDTIHVEGGLRPDPLVGATLTDVRAFAVDPDVDYRLAAAASRWNWDLRVQLVLAADSDERVVLALLDHVDPYLETVEQILAGPHLTARRLLAGRNLRSDLLERLASDDDVETADIARRNLAVRAGTHLVDLEVTR